MKVILLGTGTSQGIPVIGCNCETCTSGNIKDKRLRTSAYIETESAGHRLKLLIDTSIDFRQQMLLYDIDDIDSVLYTHHHVDHILGLDDLRQINQRLDKYIDLYGNEKTMDEIRVTFRYAFDERLRNHKAVPLINIHTIGNKNLKLKGNDIIPVECWHGKLKIFGYRINNFAYITDANRIDDKELEKLHGLDVLILNCLRHQHHPTHFNLEEAVAIAEKMKAKKTYFTHITHDLPHEKTNSMLPENIELAYDGLMFDL
jgi:phosphoribosyl 1,2-cyclic phosphate phosphodiesterase